MITLSTTEQAIEIGKSLKLCEAYQLLLARKDALRKSQHALSVMRIFDRHTEGYAHFYKLANFYATSAQLYREAIESYLDYVKN